MGLQRVRHDWVTELNWTEMDLESVIPSEKREKQICQKEKKQIPYINEYMWDLEKCHWFAMLSRSVLSDLQSRSRDTDTENGRMNTVGEEWKGEWEAGIVEMTYIHYHV